VNGRSVQRRRILALRDGTARPRSDELAAEEPLEIRVGGDAVAVTMRTPGHDFELALGFCLSEGIVTGAEQVESIRYCTGPQGAGDYNVVELALRSGATVPEAQRRRTYTTSSCGLCGTASIEAVRKQAPAVDGDGARLAVATLVGMPATLRAAQRAFDRTGGLHAAGLFTLDGTLRCLREDVGRHNAVDKVIGWAATDRLLPLRGYTLLVSGRVAFEIAQKALLAGIPIVAAVSAPSSLAVDLADESGMTLVGFLRGSELNVYAGGQRLEGL